MSVRVADLNQVLITTRLLNGCVVECLDDLFTYVARLEPGLCK